MPDDPIPPAQTPQAQAPETQPPRLGLARSLATGIVPQAQAPRAQVPRPPDGGKEPSYYDLSFLKAPVWKWEIANYFFLGGATAGVFLLARMAELSGRPEYDDIRRAGNKVAFLAMLPCAPLLILDLGDPARFHHMLRMWKPQSPMNVGAWTLTAYSGAATSAIVQQWFENRAHPPDAVQRRAASGIMKIASPVIWVLNNAVGIPAAILLAGYTGVLLSCTANPLWAQNPWLGPMFSASAIASGAEAVTLMLQAGGHDDQTSPALRALSKVLDCAHIAEVASVVGFLKHAGELARPITHGKMRVPFWASMGGLAAGAVLKHAPLRGRARRIAHTTGTLLGIASGMCLRWAMVYGGKESANDPNAARRASRSASRDASRGDSHPKNPPPATAPPE